ncbi:MAG: glycoside hydrolase family 2 protein [Bacteroides sp.]|nr:glycoside hydrolase family 2 protein [Bacteroides sp.]MCM1391082.1 glycoside hydrolase family 2 protein [Bacteroides sp.]
MKRESIVIGLLLAVMPTTLKAERQEKTINDGWDFRFPSQNEWKRVTVPHTFNADAYFSRDYYKGKGEYRRNVNIRSIDPDRRYFIRFDAANKVAEVAINNHPLATHFGGYTAFIVDVTDYLTVGNNDLAVTVDNSRVDVGPISADYTFWGGLYRDVWMITTPQVHFDMADYGSDGVAVNVRKVDEKIASVSVSAGVRNDSPQPASVLVKNHIIAPDGSIAAENEKKIKIGAMENFKVDIDFEDIKNPQLWSPDTPYLYSVRTGIYDIGSGEKLDEVVNPLGLRWFSFDADKGFFLNGKHLKLRGVNRHQDMAPLGWALGDDAHRYDFELIKELGANFVRLAHYPQDRAVLDACDRLGLLVWEEIPVVNRVDSTPGFDDNVANELVEMIRQHRNHPSVIGWGYMNEILLRAPGDNDSQWNGVRNHTLELADRLERLLKQEDQSRVSFTAFHGSDRYNKVGLNIADVTGWNLYQGWYGGDLSGFDRYLEDQHRRFPDKPVIVSEWGAGSDRRLHSLSPVPFDFSIEYQQRYVEHYLPYIETHDFVAGGAYWNFIDFNVAERQESMPRVNNKGLAYNNRELKDVAYYFKAAWRDDVPVLHIATRDWDERVVEQETLMPVKIYGNVDEVELILNGASLGKKKLDNYNCVFDVEFASGKSILSARAVKDGKDVEDVAVVDIKNAPLIDRSETLAVNVGSRCFFKSDFDKLTWLPDREYSNGAWGYIGGKDKSTTGEIFNTVDNPVYQTCREGIDEYRFDVSGGRYEVELLFADVNRPSSLSPYLLGRGESCNVEGDTRMNIEINGVTVEENYSPSDGDNYFQPVRRRYAVDSNGGGIRVKFLPLSGSPALCGIVLRRN